MWRLLIRLGATRALLRRLSVLRLRFRLLQLQQQLRLRIRLSVLCLGRYFLVREGE